MRLIPLTQGKFAKVDDADFDWLNQWKWYARRARTGHNRWYATRSVWNGGKNRKNVQMHREVVGMPGVPQIDHEDGDGLNNQRHNLRPATHSQNALNRGRNSNNTSGFKGVHWRPDKQTWHALIRFRGVREHLGYFETAEQAARAYDKRAKELFGEFARLNFP